MTASNKAGCSNEGLWQCGPIQRIIKIPILKHSQRTDDGFAWSTPLDRTWMIDR
jgi:hypothetical protein